MKTVTVGRLRLESARVLVGDPLKIDRLWAHHLYNDRDINNRSVTVCGCMAATAHGRIGDILGPQDANGGEAAVVRLDGEQAEIRVIYGDDGRPRKIEIEVCK